jgi:hypothetical protein
MKRPPLTAQQHAAAAAMVRAARTEPVRCVGCNTLRHWPPGMIHVLTYQPFEPWRHAIAYYACAACLASEQARRRLFLWAETRCRAADEDAGMPAAGPD